MCICSEIWRRCEVGDEGEVGVEDKIGDRDIVAVLKGMRWSGETEVSECTVKVSVSGTEDGSALSDTRGRREDVEEDVKLEPSCRSLTSYDVAGRSWRFADLSSVRRKLLRLNQPLVFSLGDFSCPFVIDATGKVDAVDEDASLGSWVTFGEAAIGGKGGTGGAEVEAYKEVRLWNPTMGFEGL